MTDTDKIEAAGLHLFTEWDDLPPGIRNGARNLLGCLMAWGGRLATAEQAVERLTRELDEANVAAGDYANRLDRAFDLLTREREEARAEVAELQLTGNRAELRSLLDQCGLDFERMRERALTAERERDEIAASYHDMARQMAAARDERDEARLAAEAALARTRADAIEEAAVVCDRWLSDWGAIEIDSAARPYTCEVVADISDAIRALARDTDTGGGE